MIMRAARKCVRHVLAITLRHKRPAPKAALRRNIMRLAHQFLSQAHRRRHKLRRKGNITQAQDIRGVVKDAKLPLTGSQTVSSRANIAVAKGIIQTNQHQIRLQRIRDRHNILRQIQHQILWRKAP